MIWWAALALASGLELYQEASRLFEQKRIPESAQAVERALTLDPKLVEAWILKSKLALALGRHDLAEVCLQRAISINPQSEYAHFLLGFHYYLENDFNKALPALETARKLNADDPRVLLYTALALEGLARSDEALSFYEQAVSAERAQGRLSADTLTAFGRLLFTLGRYSESEKRIREALVIDPQSRDAHYELGRLRLQAGDAPNAIREGEAALRLQSPGTTDRQVFFLLAQAYHQAGDAVKAAEYRRKFEASAPSLRR